MAGTIMQASLRELWIVGSTILLGAGLCHFMILYVQRWFARLIIQSRRQRDRLAYFSGSHFQDNFTTEKKSTGAFLSSMIKQDHRGLINDLPPWVELPLKTTWKADEQRQTLRNLFHARQQLNKRSTYLGSESFKEGSLSANLFEALGAESFKEGSLSANLFGWKRIDGQATTYFGEIACLEDATTAGGIQMRLFLHPQDAKSVVMSGWGKVVDSTKHKSKLSSIVSHNDGSVQVQLFAPRNSTEVDQVTKVVLDASIWWKAGFDNEETV